MVTSHPFRAIARDSEQCSKQTVRPSLAACLSLLASWATAFGHLGEDSVSHKRVAEYSSGEDDAFEQVLAKNFLQLLLQAKLLSRRTLEDHGTVASLARPAGLA